MGGMRWDLDASQNFWQLHRQVHATVLMRYLCIPPFPFLFVVASMVSSRVLRPKDGAAVFTDNGIINAQKKKNKKTKDATNNGMGTYDGGKVSMGKSMGKGKSMGTPKSPKSMISRAV